MSKLEGFQVTAVTYNVFQVLVTTATLKRFQAHIITATLPGTFF